MQLVIAEKPSVAMSIASVIGADERKDGYMEGGGFIVSWCVGHLAELADATHYGDYTVAAMTAALPYWKRRYRSLRSVQRES